jgi:two-component system chemotaxis response regulator CheB
MRFSALLHTNTAREQSAWCCRGRLTTRYRCHTGHGYSDSALLEGVMETTGEMLWKVMRSLEEAVMLRHMGQHAEEAGDAALARRYEAKGRELESRSKQVHEAVKHHEALSAENISSGGS